MSGQAGGPELLPENIDADAVRRFIAEGIERQPPEVRRELLDYLEAGNRPDVHLEHDERGQWVRIVVGGAAVARVHSSRLRGPAPLN